MKLRHPLLIAALLFSASTALAGSLEVSLMHEADFSRWRCGEEILTARSSEYPCANAGFGKCSACPTLVITNVSASAIKPKVRTYGPGFNHFDGRNVDFGGCKERPLQMNCEAIAPGASCYIEILACPEQSGVTSERTSVTYIEEGVAHTIIFNLAVTATYPPRLEAAEQVRKRHLAELMKIQHVSKVELDPSDGDILINVEVKEAKDIPEVQRIVPPKLDGYDVEVTEFMETGFGL